jgi:hypothetical protein
VKKYVMVEHILGMSKMKNYIKMWLEILMSRDRFGNLGVGMKAIGKKILRKCEPLNSIRRLVTKTTSIFC